VRDDVRKKYPIKGLAEDKVYRDIVADFIRDVPNPAKECYEHAFMEMMNNAIEHSDGSEVDVFLFENKDEIYFIIRDDGIGIFTKVAEALNLDEKRHAVLELTKGKFTTDPQRHSGEGIFFSSKCADFFLIDSCGIKFMTGSDYETLKHTEIAHSGTKVVFSVRLDHRQTLQELFGQYTDAPENYAFIKTVIPIQFLEYGDERPVFISRSQARRLTRQIERFKVVHLDFTGVDKIGQGFADEIFRVFKNNHADVELVPINCSEAVHQMIRHAIEYR
jgi:anti-sigma regulatory factor (Ser/Thr protein kinase)